MELYERSSQNKSHLPTGQLDGLFLHHAATAVASTTPYYQSFPTLDNKQPKASGRMLSLKTPYHISRSLSYVLMHKIVA